MIYEPLLHFDILKPGTVYPWLATSYAFSPDGRTLTFHLHPGIRWNDGTPFSSADVVYTFNLMRSNAALNSNGIELAWVTGPDANTVVMTFTSPAYTQLYANADQSLIVPKHVWQSISSPGTYPDTNPIGTGPYILKQLTPQGITLTANPHYWQPGKPQIATSTIKGWPTASNPYDPVQPGGSNSTWDEYTVLQLHL